MMDFNVLNNCIPGLVWLKEDGQPGRRDRIFRLLHRIVTCMCVVRRVLRIERCKEIQQSLLLLLCLPLSLPLFDLTTQLKCLPASLVAMS